MNETEVQIAGDSEPEESPYRNLWVPLIIVPAGIVIAIVIVFALFGAIAGEEASLAENLDRVLHGGQNDRDQALFNLARQATENHTAVSEGREPPWAVEEGFLGRVRMVVGQIDEDEYSTRLTLGVLLSSFGDPGGAEILLALLELSDDDDPQGKVRFDAILNLGLIGTPAATEPVLVFLQHEDEGLQSIAAIALQALPGEGVRAALVATLSDSVLSVRGSAAVSLSKLDPPEPAAAPVLRELAGTETYASENGLDVRKYRLGRLVSQNRVRAVQALARLGRPEDRALLESLEGDEDLAVREAALVALRDRGPR